MKPFKNILFKPKLAALYIFKINNANPKTRSVFNGNNKNTRTLSLRNVEEIIRMSLWCRYC